MKNKTLTKQQVISKAKGRYISIKCSPSYNYRTRKHEFNASDLAFSSIIKENFLDIDEFNKDYE